MIVATEFLKHDCREGNHSLKTLASHLPLEWGRHVQADPCVPTKRSTHEKLEMYIDQYLKYPEERWDKELQKQTKAFTKYLSY